MKERVAVVVIIILAFLLFMYFSEMPSHAPTMAGIFGNMSRISDKSIAGAAGEPQSTGDAFPSAEPSNR